ncbi:TIGR00255 family protein [Roseivivax lentus]|uniref:TIGR00255 family protein n=1 Tax=Roseivivax lentus TaxID=633194 RepID=A0A1N7PW66_9RHOB|nr:YicC/YloC family endoribonuclease [Roseivivax lentus]SIT14836.1 TIGR00255 family protein [Roseivivax lentus]
MRQSMTGFAATEGAGQGFGWSWEIRSVNGKGLDLRLRLPDWIEGLDATVRKRVQAHVTRGSVSVGLKIAAEGGAGRLGLNTDALSDVLAALAKIEAEARVQGLSLAAPSPSEILALRGVMEEAQPVPDMAALRDALLADFDTALAAFVASRDAEGQALRGILDGQLARIGALTEQAAERAEARRPEQAERLRSQLARVTEHADSPDEARIAQELALIAVKADVTEEIDRLRAHVAAAESMLATGGAVGRKLDFLMQEFNREANTLCSKAQSAPLTEVGLELKTLIDQMREQVQNVE